MNRKNNLSTKKVAFPHMGNYFIPVNYLLKHILKTEVIPSPPISSKTIELGNKYSPDFVCTPFKFTLGTILEAIENGADTIIQAGGGCRYGYYHELQEQIISDLGHNILFINLVSQGKTDLKKLYHDMKQIDSDFNFLKGLYYLYITAKMVKYMDKIDHYIRSNLGFEEKEGSFTQLQKQMLEAFSKVNNPLSLYLKYLKYKKQFKKIKTNKPLKPLKVGIIGELYTIMEPFANYELEKELAKYNIEVKRYTNVHYLLFEKKKQAQKYVKYAKEYIKYKMGADAADNIGRCKYLCEKKYDGIIHIKSSFCTPEIGAMPIISKICRYYDVPLLNFSFDTNTSEVGIKTRIEAFYDMIEMRKKYEELLHRD
ncbi:MAG: 2-hydroxyacyl-CoA dehydratase [Bacilli bacterium]|nr:2-hydroxyacyl-CoA dehydratase [Bacilli bacterium]